MLNLTNQILHAVRIHTGRLPLVIIDENEFENDGVESYNVTFKLEEISKWFFQINAKIYLKNDKRKIFFVMQGGHVWEEDFCLPSPIHYEDEIDADTITPYIELIKNDDSDIVKYKNNPPFECVKFLEDLSTIVHSPTGAYIKFYYDMYQSPYNIILWLIYKWYVNKIKLPLCKFNENKLLLVWLNIKKFFHELLFGKFIYGVYISDNKKIFGDITYNHPRFEYKLWIKKGIPQRTQSRLVGFVTPLHSFSNVEYSIISGNSGNNIYVISPVMMDFLRFRDEILSEKMNIINKFTWRKFFTTLKLNLKYALNYPIYWFKYKFEPID